MDSAQQDRLFEHLAAMADDLVAGPDVQALAARVMDACLDLLDVSGAGLLLEGQHGSLDILACSSDDAKELELLELQCREGPCYVAFETSREVLIEDLETMAGEWPTFVAAARAQGIRAAGGLPLGVAGRTVGALNLFRTTTRPLCPRNLQLAQLLCSIATVGVIQHRRLRDYEELAIQLQTALDSRVSIEQAKGVIAARAGVSVTVAFEMLRSAARASQRPLSQLAADIVSGRAPWTRFGPGGSADGVRSAGAAGGTRS